MGSPPRMRGAAIDVPKASIAPRIIPARAGSSSNRSMTIGTSRDHPRVCGEQPGMRDRRDGFLESSPRVRGAGCEYTIDKDGNGIIPACAGSRRCVQAITSEWRDHPRACGEQRSNNTTVGLMPGSSPRVRGAVDVAVRHHHGRGIIPARAGSRLDSCV